MTAPDQIGCPTCGTILNAATSVCSDGWHYDNRLATGGIVETGPSLVAEDGGCVMPPKLTLRFTDEAEIAFMERFRAAMAQPQRITVLPPSESEREQAAYERGVAEGRRQGANEIALRLDAIGTHPGKLIGSHGLSDSALSAYEDAASIARDVAAQDGDGRG